jgi:hypothetical protein
MSRHSCFATRAWVGAAALALLMFPASALAQQSASSTSSSKPAQQPATASAGEESAAKANPREPSATDSATRDGKNKARPNSDSTGKTEEDRPGSPTGDLPAWARVTTEFAKILLSWQVLVGLVVAYFVFATFAPYRLARLLRPFRSVKLFGAEFQLSEEVGADAEQAIEILRKQVKRQVDILVESYAVRAKLEAVIHDVQEILHKRSQLKDLRFTLHTPDILFADTLYQLVDYYPRGGGRGRTFSFRFGIIGLAWRARGSFVRGEVPTDPQELVRRWGMSNEEAVASGGGRQSFAAILLNDEVETPIAIFYMDTAEKHAFGADNAESGESKDETAGKGDTEFRDHLIKSVLEACKQKGLIASLTKVNDSLRDRRPTIHIHEQ